jgi:hypothetical protein
LSPFWLIFAERCRSLAKNVDVASSWEFFKLAVTREMTKIENYKARFLVFIAFFVNIKNKTVHLFPGIIKKIKHKMPQKSHKE